MNDRQRLEAIVSVVCKYLPPEGISKDQAINEIIPLVDPLPEQEQGEPVAKYIGEGSEGSLVQLLEDVKKGTDFYTTPQRNPNFQEFLNWASRASYDTAYTFDTERSKWICLNPMTADLWKAWQAAHGIKEKNT